MFRPLHCIALRTVKHSDRSNILTVFSLEAGRVALLVPAGQGKAASRYRALTMPMSVFECQAMMTPGREIFPFKDLRPDPQCLQGDFSNPVRRALAFFLSEFFNATLREPIGDEAMFHLIRDTARRLATDSPNRLANLHLLTLVRVGRLLGLEPDASTYSPGRAFDMREGRWSGELGIESSDALYAESARAAYALTRMTPDNYGRYRFNRRQRTETLEKTLAYLAIHGVGKSELTSLDVVRDLF